MIHLGRLDPDGALELTREVFADGTAAGRRLRALGPGYCLLEREGVSRWRLSGVSLGTSGTQVRRALATLPAPVAPTATSAPTASSSAPSVEISPQPTPAEPVREVPAPTARRRPWLGLGPLDAPAVEPPAARITVAVPPGFGKVARGTVPSAPKAAAPSPAPAPPPVAVPVPTASAPPRSTRAPKRSTVKPAPRRPAPRPRVEAPPVDDAIRAAVHGAVAEVFEVLRAELAATLARVEARFRGGGGDFGDA